MNFSENSRVFAPTKFCIKSLWSGTRTTKTLMRANVTTFFVGVIKSTKFEVDESSKVFVVRLPDNGEFGWVPHPTYDDLDGLPPHLRWFWLSPTTTYDDFAWVPPPPTTILVESHHRWPFGRSPCCWMIGSMCWMSRMQWSFSSKMTNNISDNKSVLFFPQRTSPTFFDGVTLASCWSSSSCCSTMPQSRRRSSFDQEGGEWDREQGSESKSWGWT